MRRALRVLFVAVLALPVVGISNVAHAAPSVLTCPGAVTFNFSPGIGLIPGNLHVTGTIAVGTSLLAATPCTSPTGVPYIGGTGTVDGTGSLSCLGGIPGVTGSVHAVVDFSWNNGDTSVITVDVLVAGLVPVLAATVTSGALQGAVVTGAPVPTGLTGNCVLAPVTSLTFAGVVAYVGT